MYEFPQISLPNKCIEEVYNFRCKVFLKHIKETEDGIVITEFFNPVSWAGKHNTIMAPVGHHLAEAKWLRNGRRIVQENTAFWLSEKSRTYTYSTWILDAFVAACDHFNDYSFAIAQLDAMVHYYETVEREHQTACGLFWSVDVNDGMEFSISGGTDEKGLKKGIRPTLNCYMAANTRAIAKVARLAGRIELATVYEKKFEDLKSCINDLLWVDGFYRAIHTEEYQLPIPKDQDAKELIGYLPWAFDLAPKGRESVFSLLKDESGFSAPFGLTTAERSHLRYLFEIEHECLWNGYVWPFATAQTLNAVLKLLDTEQDILTESDFFQMLLTYAKMHTRNGKPWIDEVMHPETGEWSSRAVLESWGWPERKGGEERGRDYNHSTFCDLVLGGLLGIRTEGGVPVVTPRVPKDWERFEVHNLWIGNRCFDIVYDKGKVTIKERKQ